MTQEDDAPRNRVADRIIRSRGETPSAHRADGGNDDHAYQAAILTEGFPQMGFSIFCASGKRHAFFYHNLDNLDQTDGKHGSYISLSHRGKVATLRGHHLHEMFNGIMEHTLQAIYEFDPAAYPEPPEGEPIVDFIRVTDINPKPPKEGEKDQ